MCRRAGIFQLCAHVLLYAPPCISPLSFTHRHTYTHTYTRLTTNVKTKVQKMRVNIRCSATMRKTGFCTGGDSTFRTCHTMEAICLTLVQRGGGRVGVFVLLAFPFVIVFELLLPSFLLCAWGFVGEGEEGMVVPSSGVEGSLRVMVVEGVLLIASCIYKCCVCSAAYPSLYMFDLVLLACRPCACVALPLACLLALLACLLAWVCVCVYVCVK
jgi:hypothetical protein